MAGLSPLAPDAPAPRLPSAPPPIASPLTPEQAATLKIPRRSRDVNPNDIIPDVPRDAIPPLFQPIYEGAIDVESWLREDDTVLGFELNGDARAFPLRIMNWHEIVNDTIGGQEVVVTYCPLCRSGIVFDSRLRDGTMLTFGNTGALYQSAMVMYDRETESAWWQAAGEAITEPLKGAYLRPLPSIVTTWFEWRAMFPDTRVLSRETGYLRSYGVDVFAGYEAAIDRPPSWPVSVTDSRLLPTSKVLGLVGTTESVAYALSALPAGSVLYDEFEGRTVVVFKSGESGGNVFEAALDGQALRFSYDEGKFVDAGTGSTWDLSGEAFRGELKGKKLTPLPTYAMYWFSWVQFQPETRVAPAR